MIRFRELIASLEWGEADTAFRLSRLGVGADATSGARLTTPEGQVIDLGEAEWRALAAAVERLFGPTEAVEKKTARNANLPPNTGQPWTSDLDGDLRTHWQEGRTVHQIADRMGRTNNAISSRLVRLGLVESREEATQAPEASPFTRRAYRSPDGQEPAP